MSATRRGIRDPVNVLGNEIYSGHARDRNRDRRYKKTRIKRTFVCPGPLVGPGVTGDRGRSDKKKKNTERPTGKVGRKSEVRGLAWFGFWKHIRFCNELISYRIH